MPRPTDDRCPSCEREYSHERREVYRRLCLDCYREKRLPCEVCRVELLPETHRSHDGRCFECYFQSRLEEAPEDPEPAIQALRDDLGHPLPEAYLDFLRHHDGVQRYRHRKTGEKDWFLASVQSGRSPCLSDPSLIDGDLPFHAQLRAHALILQEVHEKGTHPLDPKLMAEGIPRLQRAFAVAEENADFLFLDPGDDLSLWCFYHSSLEVIRLAVSFEAWFSRTRKLYKPIKRTARAHRKKMADWVGYWVPTERPTKGVGRTLYAHLELLADERARRLYVASPVGPITAESFSIWRLFGKDKLGLQGDHEHVLYRLPDGSLEERNTPELVIRYVRREDGRPDWA